MPIYEYSCKSCDHRFETLVQGDEQVECPECNGTKLAKLLSLPGAPKVASSSPGSCDTTLPPCGPGCCRL